MVRGSCLLGAAAAAAVHGCQQSQHYTTYAVLTGHLNDTALLLSSSGAILLSCLQVRLAVAGAFHTQYMAPAAAKLQEALNNTAISTPRIPVISNVDAQPHSDPAVIKEILAKQVSIWQSCGECSSSSSGNLTCADNEVQIKLCSLSRQQRQHSKPVAAAGTELRVSPHLIKQHHASCLCCCCCCSHCTFCVCS